MLIRSTRHRPEDLTLWADLEDADLIHGERLMRSSKVARSIESIQRFVANGCDYAGWSGGKDSTVVAHLIFRAGVDVPLFHIRAKPVANPDNDIVRDAMLQNMPGMKYTERTITYATIFMDGRDNPDGNRQFFAAFRERGTRYISGIRADESGVRKIRMRKFGLSSQNTCAPLGWWTAADCFGYLAIHGLPVHAAYAMLGGGRWERHQIRVDELAGHGGAQYGRSEWEREYYSDVINRLAS